MANNNGFNRIRTKAFGGIRQFPEIGITKAPPRSPKGVIRTVSRASKAATKGAKAAASLERQGRAFLKRKGIKQRALTRVGATPTAEKIVSYNGGKVKQVFRSQKPRTKSIYGKGGIFSPAR